MWKIIFPKKFVSYNFIWKIFFSISFKNYGISFNLKLFSKKSMGTFIDNIYLDSHWNIYQNSFFKSPFLKIKIIFQCKGLVLWFLYIDRQGWSSMESVGAKRIWEGAWFVHFCCTRFQPKNWFWFMRTWEQCFPSLV